MLHFTFPWSCPLHQWRPGCQSYRRPTRLTHLTRCCYSPRLPSAPRCPPLALGAITSHCCCRLSLSIESMLCSSTPADVPTVMPWPSTRTLILMYHSSLAFASALLPSLPRGRALPWCCLRHPRAHSCVCCFRIRSWGCTRICRSTRTHACMRRHPCWFLFALMHVSFAHVFRPFVRGPPVPWVSVCFLIMSPDVGMT